MQSGESATRLGSVTDRKVIGVKSKGMDMLGFLSKEFAPQSGPLIRGVKPRQAKNRLAQPGRASGLRLKHSSFHAITSIAVSPWAKTSNRARCSSAMQPSVGLKSGRAK
jgi:hypothetical protein